MGEGAGVKEGGRESKRVVNPAGRHKLLRDKD